MLLTLDGKRLPDQDGSTRSLQDLVDQVRGDFLPERIVVAVRIDGEALVGEALSARLAQPIGTAAQIDLESADPLELAAGALRELTEQLADAREGLAQIAGMIQSGRPDEALGDFRGFLAVWRSSQSALRECSGLLARDLTAEDLNGQPLLVHIESLGEKLRELRDAFEARDMVLLSDLVEYEMPELCEAWQGHFQTLADRLVSPRAVPASHP